jgi:hypothetical protein
VSEIYTASIRETRWIDLSDKHDLLRRNLEESIRSSCIEEKDANPVQINGAFRIGKSQILYYLFHYAWSELQIPAFFARLDTIVEILKSAAEQKGKKIRNDSVTGILNEYFENQMQVLKTSLQDGTVGPRFDLPDIQSHQNVRDYFDALGSGSVIGSDGQEKRLEPITAERAVQILSGQPRFLLLVDEFEEAYHRINGVVESTGGGPLRQFFEDVSKQHTNFFLVIACGPAASFKIRSGMTQGSIAAQTGRIRNLQMPFPNVDSLKKTFLNGHGKGYANFIWWLSRRRPGWIKKLHEELNAEELINQSYDAFIENNRSSFDTNIDSLGESGIHVLEYSVCQKKFATSDSLDRIKNLLVLLQPHEVHDPESSFDLIESCKNDIHFSEELIPLKNILDALSEDLKNNYAEAHPDRKYDERNLFRIYLRHIFQSVSDEQEQMAIGLALDEDKRKRTVEIFLLPVLGLLYDFMAEYEDETDTEIRHLLNFIYNLTYSLEKDPSPQKRFRKTLALIKSYDPNDLDQGWMQLNFRLIRELIQQPVGSPELSYRGEPVNEKLTIQEEWEPCSFALNVDTAASIQCRILLVPDFSTDRMEEYMAQLKDHIQKDWESCSLDGGWMTIIVFLGQSDTIGEFEKWLSTEAGVHAGFCHKTQKIVVLGADRIADDLSDQIAAFLGSLCKIAMIEEDDKWIEEDNKILYIDKIVGRIQQADWPIRKEERRTIAYFWERSQNALRFLANDCVDKYCVQINKCLGTDVEEIGRFAERHLKFHLTDKESLAAFELVLLAVDPEKFRLSFEPIMQNLHCIRIPSEWDMPVLNQLIQVAEWVTTHKKEITHNPMRSELAEKLGDLSRLFDDPDSLRLSDESPLEKILLPLVTTETEKPVRMFLRAVFYHNKAPIADTQESLSELKAMKDKVVQQKEFFVNKNREMTLLFGRDEKEPEILDINELTFLQNKLMIPLCAAMEGKRFPLRVLHLPIVLAYHVEEFAGEYHAKTEPFLKQLDSIVSEFSQLKLKMDEHHAKFMIDYADDRNQKLFWSYDKNPKKAEVENFYKGIVLQSFRASDVYQKFFSQPIAVQPDKLPPDIDTRAITFLSENKESYLKQTERYESLMSEIVSKVFLVQQVMDDIDIILEKAKEKEN